MSDLTSSAATRHYFGTDGVRGVANTELSPQLALSLGAALALVLGTAGARPQVVLGYDGRISGDLLGAALSAGLCSQGVSVIDLGLVPTPGVSFATRQGGAMAGVVISASHNPVADNGIKFFGPNGKKLPDAVEADIEAALAAWDTAPRPSGANVGRITRTTAPVDEYAAFLAASLGNARLDGLTLVVDCANGAASHLAPRVLRGLGARVIALHAGPSGTNINDNCGSLHPEEIAARVASENADAGLAFDGDADRVILADEQGRLFDGDRILCTLGLYYAAQNALPGNAVVGTVMSNLGLEQALARRGLQLVRAKVGDRYVAEDMARLGATVGGEKSGHILLPALAPTGDGLLTGLQILKICRDSDRPLSSWANEMQELPQKLVNVRVTERDGWESVASVADALRHAEARLEGRGRIFVRPSGTEKMIRVMAEGPDEAEVNDLVASVADALRADRGI